MKRFLSAAFIAVLAASSAAYADGNHAKKGPGDMAEGEIRRVDKDAKKLTIKHGPLAKLDMPPMTMVFQVRDPAMLEQVKPGDKVRFDAEKIGGGYVVTRIEVAK